MTIVCLDIDIKENREKINKYIKFLLERVKISRQFQYYINHPKIFNLDGTDIKINFFNKNAYNLNKSLICIIGGKSSGKTTLACNLMNGYDEDYHRDSLILSSSIHQFNDVFSTILTTSTFNMTLFNDYITRYSGCIVMDGCLSLTRGYGRSGRIEIMDTTVEADHKLRILTVKYPSKRIPVIDIDYIFMMYDSFSSNQKKLYEFYAKNIFPNLKSFKKIYKELTKNYGCLVINNKIITNDISKKIFWLNI